MTCEWCQDGTYQYWWFQKCDKNTGGYTVDDEHPLPEFCPFCGGKVVVVENWVESKFNNAINDWLRKIGLMKRKRNDAQPAAITLDSRFEIKPIAVFGLYNLHAGDEKYPIMLDQIEDLYKSCKATLELYNRLEGESG